MQFLPKGCFSKNLSSKDSVTPFNDIVMWQNSLPFAIRDNEHFILQSGSCDVPTYQYRPHPRFSLRETEGPSFAYPHRIRYTCVWPASGKWVENFPPYSHHQNCSIERILFRVALLWVISCETLAYVILLDYIPSLRAKNEKIRFARFERISVPSF